MKLLITIVIACISLNITAQTNNIFPKTSFIESYKLEVTYNKTTNLIFPAAITSVDRGSQDILVQKAPGVENILRIKADVKDFSETSLSVITADGKLYSFIVSYTMEPDYININVGKIFKKDSVFSEQETNRAVLIAYADSVEARASKIHAVHKKSSKVSIAMNAIYIHEDVLYTRFILKNNSYINYDIDQLHFYIRDRRKPDRTASQEIELTPLLITGDTVTIHSGESQSWVIALPKFTIPDGKYLAVEMMERNGGRNLFLKIKCRHVMKAQPL